MADSQWLIDAEYADCRSTNCCQPFERTNGPCEMLGPYLTPRIEERMQKIRIGIVARRIWSLVQTARGTTERQVLDDCGATVLLRSNMIQMKRARIVVLRELAVFATTERSFPNLLTSRRRHDYSVPLCPACFSDNRAFACRIATT